MLNGIYIHKLLEESPSNKKLYLLLIAETNTDKVLKYSTKPSQIDEQSRVFRLSQDQKLIQE